MLKRLLLSGLAIGVLCLASPAFGLIDPNADVLYHPVTNPTSEPVLTAQMSATHVAVYRRFGIRRRVQLGLSKPSELRYSSVFVKNPTKRLTETSTRLNG